MGLLHRRVSNVCCVDSIAAVIWGKRLKPSGVVIKKRKDKLSSPHRRAPSSCTALHGINQSLCRVPRYSFVSKYQGFWPLPPLVFRSALQSGLLLLHLPRLLPIEHHDFAKDKNNMLTRNHNCRPNQAVIQMVSGSRLCSSYEGRGWP